MISHRAHKGHGEWNTKINLNANQYNFLLNSICSGKTYFARHTGKSRYPVVEFSQKNWMAGYYAALRGPALVPFGGLRVNSTHHESPE
jgi:hypothetical protein